MLKLRKLYQVLRGNSKGVSLIEVIVALAILGIIAAAFLGGLSTTYKVDILASERTNAESLTRSEFEYIKNVSYDSFYNSDDPPSLLFPYEIPDDPPDWDPSRTLDDHYAGFSVNVSGVPIDPKTHDHLTSGIDQGMQEITVKVYHQGKLVLTTSSYKVLR